MEADIEARVATDFAVEDRDNALGFLELLAAEEDGSPRILRCVLYLARGDLSLLVHYADRARSDCRDVFFWAEYDEMDQRIRDFNRPFGDSG